MFTIRRLRLFAVAVLAASFPAALAASDKNAPRFEFFVTGGLSPAGTGASYVHSYDPNPGYKIPGSFGRQTLQIDPAGAGAFSAGAGFYFSDGIGLRATVSVEKASLGGANGPFEFLFKYTGYFVPYFQPFDTSVSLTKDWPPTQGSLRRVMAGLEFVLRLPVSPAFGVALSAGPQMSFLNGDVYPVAYTRVSAYMRGYPFFHDDVLRLKLPARTAVGLKAGIEAMLRLAAHLFLRFEGAYRGAETYEGVPEISQGYAANTFADLAPEDLAQIRSRVALNSLTLSFSPLSLSAGVSVGF